MKQVLTFVLLLLSATAASAQANEPYLLRGTMRHTDLEGGCWYLEADGGKKFELTGEIEDMERLHQEDKAVSVSVTPAKGMSSFCMLGPILRVIAIHDTVRYPVDIGWSRMMISGSLHRLKNGCWYFKTDKGFKYELGEQAFKGKRKIGRTYKGAARIYDAAIGKCHMNGVLMYEEPNYDKNLKSPPVDPKSGIIERKRADPR